MKKQLIVCVSPYEHKYYFEDEFKDIPKEVQQELLEKIAKVAEKVNAILSVGYYPDGKLYIEQTNKEDVFVDEIGAALEIKRFQSEEQELIKSLQMWYMMYRTEKGMLLREVVVMQSQKMAKEQIIGAITKKHGEEVRAFVELMLEDE